MPANQFSLAQPIADPGQLPNFNLNLSGRPSGSNQKRGFSTSLGAAQATQRTLPGLLNTFYQGLNVNAPLLAQGQLDIMQRFGPQFATAQNEIDKIGQMGSAERDFETASGAGRKLTGELAAQDRMVNPEFYRGREAYTNRGLELLSGMDPNKLTESEMANVERTANRNNIGRGTANSGSNIAGIQNALMFDDRLQNKRNQLSNVLTSFGNTLPGLRSDFNSLFATGKGGTDQSALKAVLPAAGLNLASDTSKTTQGIFGDYTGKAKQAQSQEVSPAIGLLSALPDY